ncbi:DUF305 domain-containing protein [Lutibaculum baratangense]|uniref:DUF305 domain-containing protein n=1 Tax=Lutibaculum baratangense AMV1 TaxID=631454 RepID=V4RAL0_9HYPH|nr:DUF305 domain-containing protein [Lutibaculum baratangense]ESR23216.1 Hypothetical protein involved in heavy metal export [Lutibaculum baratangense AMV1]
MSYGRFAAMIATSTIVMFGLMYLNTYAWEHIFFSETRVYMAILMGGAMAVVMMGYMFAMYPNRAANVAIMVAGVVVLAGSLWLVRSQATVGQVSYMRAMIPHHSIAIMTSERAEITDPRVRKLADEIIEAQQREIAEMRYLIADIEEHGGAEPSEVTEADEPPEVASLREALSRTVIATLDPEPMPEAEADDVVPPGAPGCDFVRTAESDPILVARAGETGPAQGVMKLNGELVALRSEGSDGFDTLLAGPTMAADGVTMAVRHLPDEEPETENGRQEWKADLVFELDQGLTVGYRGFYRCDRQLP